jgi:hypothetical protein
MYTIMFRITKQPYFYFIRVGELPVRLYQDLRWERRVGVRDWHFLRYGQVSLFHHRDVSGSLRGIRQFTRR